MSDATLRSRPLAALFEKIYEQGRWGSSPEGARYFSGPGSLPRWTSGYERLVADLVEQRDVRTLVDLGCGDFQVAARILARCRRPVAYVGCDVAANVVAHDATVHGRPGVEFRCLDVTRDPLPAGDLVMVREVFQHLSNRLVHAALANIRATYRTAVVTEAIVLQPAARNLDLGPGRGTRDELGSGLYLDEPPFCLPVTRRFEMPCSPSEAYRTIIVDFRGGV